MNIKLLNKLKNNSENDNLEEPFIENMNNADLIDDLMALKYIDEKIEQSNENINTEIKNNLNKKTSEIIAKENSIVSNILFDFMIDNQNGSNIEKVYEKLQQENNDINRNNQIKTYYNKTYNEYIFILKVVICLIVLLLPIIFLNKYEMINQDISLIIITSIIIFGVLFISYRLYLLYMRDNINFDKIKVPYDRQTNNLIKQGKMESKGSIFKNLGVVCVGDECCDTSMVYDNLNNKCVLSENFGNYFESLHNENKKINIIEPYEIENFATIENVTSTKEELLRNSLVQSSNIRYN